MYDVEQEPVVRKRARAVDLSILIVTWNSERWIDRCLRSIPAACEGLEYEVVVHDNASTDRTIDHLGEAKVLRASENVQVAVSIDESEVAGMVPAIPERSLQVRPVAIAAGHRP